MKSEHKTVSLKKRGKEKIKKHNLLSSAESAINIMHQFLSTAPPPMENSEDSYFSFFTAWLKALHYRDMLAVTALLFIILNFPTVF